MLIPDAFITDEIHATDDYKEYETVSPTLSVVTPQKKKRKQVVGEICLPRKLLKVTIKQKKAKTTPIPPPTAEAQENVAKVQEKLAEEEIEKMVEEPKSHKKNPKTVDDDDDENKNDKKDDDDKKNDDNDDHTYHTLELTKTVSPSNATTSKAQHKTRRISSKYSHIPEVIHRMCRRQGYMIQRMEKKYVTDRNLKRFVADTIIQERDALQAEVPALVLKEFSDQAPQIIEELFKSYVSNNVIQVHPTTNTSTSINSSVVLQQQLYLKMKFNLQDQAADSELWDVLKRKFEKSSTLTTSFRDDAFCP
ncbi:hypothetical protein Tco_0399992 [Tanacetum coccineum]